METRPGRQARNAGVVVTRRSMSRAIWHVDDLATEFVDELETNPDQAVSAGSLLKDGDRCTVVRLDRDDQSFVLKRYNAKGALHTATHLLLRSRAQWSFLNGRRLIAGGLPTPRPLACVEERSRGMLKMRSFLLTEFIAGPSLREAVDSDVMSLEDLRELAKQFARIWQALGQLRIGHGDMKATNFIIGAEKRLWLIDLDGMRVYKSGTMLRRERRKDLARFMKNWQDQPEVAAAFRARIGTG